MENKSIQEQDHKERRAPLVSASDYPVGTGKTGIDGNHWTIREDVNNRHIWIMDRNKTYLSRSKSKSKNKSKKSKSKNKSKNKSMKRIKKRNKSLSRSRTKSLSKERVGPIQSATLYKVGTIKIGNDGNKWIIAETKDGIKRWQKYKKIN